MSITEQNRAVGVPSVEYRFICRNGALVGFEPSKAVAMSRAFLAVSGIRRAASARIRRMAAVLWDAAVAALLRRWPRDSAVNNIEGIQERLGLALIRSGKRNDVRVYILHHQGRVRARSRDKASRAQTGAGATLRVLDGGNCRALPVEVLKQPQAASLGFEGTAVSSAILAARALIGKCPARSYVMGLLRLHAIQLEAPGEELGQAEMEHYCEIYVPVFARRFIEVELLDPGLQKLDSGRHSQAHQQWSDAQFGYRGLQTLDAAAFCTSVATVSSCPKRSAREPSWGWRSTRRTAKRAGRGSNACCRASTDSMSMRSTLTMSNSRGLRWQLLLNDTAFAVIQGDKRKGEACSYFECEELDIGEILVPRTNADGERSCRKVCVHPARRVRAAQIRDRLTAGCVGAECGNVQGGRAVHADRRCRQIGLDPCLQRETNASPWMDRSVKGEQFFRGCGH